MSTSNLIQLLLQGSALLSQCATKSEKEKNARQLISASFKFLDLAKQIRIGALTIKEEHVAACEKEVIDTIDAATKADGEAQYPIILVEANEAITVVSMRIDAGPQFAATRSSVWPTAVGADSGRFPVSAPDTFPWPHPWPIWPAPFPRPWPPNPWGPDPRWWDQRNWVAGSEFRF